MFVPVRESPAGAVLDRGIALFVVLAAAAMVWMLSSAQPDARGYGTHEQLGMSPCSWPRAVGAPCPTCGVTTAATRLIHLDPLGALEAQPFGAALAVVGLALAALALWSLVRGGSFLLALTLLPYGSILRGLLVLLLGSWLYKYLTFSPPT